MPKVAKITEKIIDIKSNEQEKRKKKKKKI